MNMGQLAFCTDSTRCLGQAICAAQLLKLDQDSTDEMRRRLWWEICTADVYVIHFILTTLRFLTSILDLSPYTSVAVH